MASIIVAQLILISVFKFWPEIEYERPVFDRFEEEAIIVEEMIITRQANAPASPPKPQVPIPVPNDNIIEEEILEFPEMDDLLNTDPLSESITTGQRGNEERISGNPDRPPRVVKIVEPVIPDEAKRADIKAIVAVNFTVFSDGTVKEAYIAEIRLYEKNGEDYKIVSDIGYGLLEATLEAAYQWRFRPATDEGGNVGAYTQDVFTFGF
ncbi:MAG: hypothetical protein JJ971_09910 [Balneolaceae bacterium]|nr:hypothetical protein [Balneolaceae bacterium]MBO6546438.1 hypothetical protein [Balneolaceae bacterium]MBO6648797.1 hypothetical protein [Balneolaceae bacterium]